MGEQASVARIVVSEDDRLFVELMTRALELRGHDVAAVGNGRKALALCRAGDVDAVVCDLVTPDQDGIETIRTLHRDWPGLAIIAVSGGVRIGTGTVDYLEAAQRLGADAVLKKPFLPGVFAELVEATIAARSSSGAARRG